MLRPLYKLAVGHEVSLDAQQYFYVLAVLFQLVCLCHRIREGVYHAVIRYCYCLMAPAGCGLYGFLNVCQAVHAGHLGMKMQLYALLLGLVRANRSWLPAHVPREYAHSPEPLIHHILSGDDKYILLFLYAGYGIDDAILALLEKHLAGNRVCMVAYGKCQYSPAVFLLCSLQG